MPTGKEIQPYIERISLVVAAGDVGVVVDVMDSQPRGWMFELQANVNIMELNERI